MENEQAQLQMKGFWLDPKDQVSNIVFGASLNSIWRLPTEWLFRIGVSFSERNPTHIERFGYFLYNPLDGYFYTGNPNLETEKSLQAEFSFQKSHAKGALEIAVFANELRNYITGVWQSEEFKVYQNFDKAILTGLELAANYNVSQRLDLIVNGEFTYGINRGLDEPVAQMPPLSISLTGVWEGERLTNLVEQQFKMRQNRVATIGAGEEETPGYYLLNLRQELNVSNTWKLKWGVENLFDNRYRDHLSLQRLPGQGRNIYFGLALGYQ